MFWLFKRKKVADKKPITPCVCDNGVELSPSDALHLQELGVSRTEEPCGGGGGGGRGYQRLTAPQQPLAECTPSCSGSESSGSDNERDFFDAFTDTDDEDEELTCNFCERSFHSVRRLEQHQQRKRHYMCSVCDTVFDGLMLLEMHKETLDHWSDYELRLRRAAQPSSSSSSGDEEGHRGGDEMRRLLL